MRGLSTRVGGGNANHGRPTPAYDVTLHWKTFYARGGGGGGGGGVLFQRCESGPPARDFWPCQPAGFPPSSCARRERPHVLLLLLLLSGTRRSDISLPQGRCGRKRRTSCRATHRATLKCVRVLWSGGKLKTQITAWPKSFPVAGIYNFLRFATSHRHVMVTEIVVEGSFSVYTCFYSHAAVFVDSLQAPEYSGYCSGGKNFAFDVFSSSAVQSC